MNNESNRRITLTKKMLKDALVELLNEKEISQITVRELCEVADINRSTFYAHYKDQFDLLDSIEEDILDNSKKILKNISFNEVPTKIIEYFLIYIKENGQLFKVLLCKQESSLFKEKIIKIIISQLQNFMKIDVNENLIPYVYAFLLNGCIAIIVNWINSSFDLTPKQITDLFVSLGEKTKQIKIN